VRVFAYLAAIVLGLAACSPAPSATDDRTSAPTPRAAALPRVAVVTDDGSGRHLVGRPIDPVTLADLDGYASLSFGHHFVEALSPSGRTLAAILWPSGSSNAGGVLHLIDAPTWTDRATEVTFGDHVDWLFFAGNDQRLIWVRSNARATTWRVVGFDVGSKEPADLLELPAGFAPIDAALFGDRLVLVGSIQENSITTGDAHVVMVDLARRAIAKDEGLAGLRAGQYKVEEGSQAYPYRQITPGVAWDLARGKGYIVDAEQDLVTVIDVAAASVAKPRALQTRRSLVDRLLSLISTPADAKMVSSTRKQAALSPDGRVLFVAGSREDVTNDLAVTTTPLGLSAVDTVDFGIIATASGPTDRIVFTGDRQIAVAAAGVLKVLSSADLREVGASGVQADFFLSSVARGSEILVTTSRPTRVYRIDMSSGGSLGFRELTPFYGVLIDLGR